mgnify:CR=1 FL=1
MPLSGNPTFALQPNAERVALATNYITDFNFLNQYLPDTYEKEFERYGNRSVSSFLRMVGAEMPSNSDMIKWRCYISSKRCHHRRWRTCYPSRTDTSYFSERWFRSKQGYCYCCCCWNCYIYCCFLRSWWSCYCWYSYNCCWCYHYDLRFWI